MAASLFQKQKSDNWSEVIELLADQLLKKVNQEPINIQKTRQTGPIQPDISDAETSGNDGVSDVPSGKINDGVSIADCEVGKSKDKVQQKHLK